MMKIESKEKLAKLLAIEDLDIQHQQVQTAMFDLKNRILVLPVWKDMPNHLYDLLVGHEVGHALFTPTKESRLKKIIKKTSKDCVNVIEDARIETLIKRRYPGLRKQFHKGYNHLIEKDFFGLKKRDINDADFLDRVNIHFKVPQYGDVLFNKEEQKLVDLIEKAKSFSDVEKVAVKVHAYCKKHDKHEDSDNSEAGDNPQDNVDGTGESQVFNSESNEAGDSGESESGKTDSIQEESQEESKEEENSVSDEEVNNGSNDEQESKDGGKGEEEKSKIDKEALDKPKPDEVVAKTQRHFDERVKSELVDTSHNVLYVNVPDKINENAVESYKKVHHNLNKFYSGKSSEWHPYENQLDRVYSGAKDMLQKLKKDSVKTVNHIAMEFERKKAADVYKKTLITKSGVLDTNKMFSAKYNEDVFKKNVRIPEGKNHGLVMFIDWSGSMACSIAECIKQVIELTFFCKKVNIPFEVYSFTDRMGAERNVKAFDYRHGDAAYDSGVKLRNYISSRMSNKEYNNALLNLCILAGRFNVNGYVSYNCPSADELASTPLNGAILLSEHVIRDFKNKHALESVHAVWLTDGEGNRNTGKWNAEKGFAESFHNNDTWTKDDPILGKVYLKDKKTRKDYLVWSKNDYVSATPALFDMVKDRLGINIVGFFILPNFKPSSLWRYTPKHIDYHGYGYGKHKDAFQEWLKKIRKDGYFVKTEAGYDEYYVLNNKPDNKPVGEITDNMTTRKMVSIFSKKNNQFKVKRVILSRFVDLITAKI